MIDFSLDRVRGAVVIDTRREKGKDDNGNKIFPVKYRITYNRKQTYYRTGVDLTLNDWIALETSKAHELSRTRGLLKAGLRRIEEEVEQLVKSKEFSFQALNKRLGRSKDDSVSEAFRSKIEALKAAGRINYAIIHETTLLNLNKFASSIRFAEITPEWLRRFENHLIRDGKSRTSIAIYFRCLKSVVNEFGNLSEAQYPFSKSIHDKRFRIMEGSGHKRALSMEQIKKLIEAPLIKPEYLRARDYFIFSYLCNGINFADLFRLTTDNIDRHSNEIIWVRAKTVRSHRKEKVIRAALLPEMEAILKRWGQGGKYLFPVLSEGMTPEEETLAVKRTTSLTNSKLKIIGENLGIGPISSYFARHSFATILKQKGISIGFISEQLGHSNINTTENYLSSFESDERRKNASRLTDFL